MDVRLAGFIDESVVVSARVTDATGDLEGVVLTDTTNRALVTGTIGTPGRKTPFGLGPSTGYQAYSGPRIRFNLEGGLPNNLDVTISLSWT